jgi:hypothetical protein
MPRASEPDTLSFDGAQTLKSRIERFWVARGYAPVCVIERISLPNPRGEVHTRLLYAVRSDMVNGVPRNKIAA